jgi:hypothetical protein
LSVCIHLVFARDLIKEIDKILMFSFLGIALLSMCIQLMQEEIIGKIRWLAASVGLGEDHSGFILQLLLKKKICEFEKCCKFQLAT